MRRIGRTFYVPRARLKQVVRVDLSVKCYVSRWCGGATERGTRTPFQPDRFSALWLVTRQDVNSATMPHGYDEPESFFFSAGSNSFAAPTLIGRAAED